MQKNMIKAIGVFTLVLFVLSVTGAAASSCSSCIAKPDSYSLTKTKNMGSTVLKNDKGSNLKVVSVTKCSKGTVSMRSNGAFTYKAKSCAKGTITDKFRYTIKNSCGKTSSAWVTIRYRCN